MMPRETASIRRRSIRHHNRSLNGRSTVRDETLSKTAQPAIPPTAGPTSQAARVMKYVSENPDSATGVIARAVGLDSSRASAALSALKKSGRVLSTGPRGQMAWTAASA